MACNHGQTPVKSLGVTDQHSQLQLYTEGPYDKVITFLKVENFRAQSPIPHGCEEFPDVAFLGGKSLNQLIEAERKGTEYALYKKGRMSQTITLPEVNAHTLGQLIYFYRDDRPPTPASCWTSTPSTSPAWRRARLPPMRYWATLARSTRRRRRK